LNNRGMRLRFEPEGPPERCCKKFFFPPRYRCPECGPGNRLNGKNGNSEVKVPQVSGKERI